jgi:hypothetical protein
MEQKTRKRLMDRKIVELIMEGKSLREIRRILKVGDRRINRAKALGESYGYLNGSRPLPPYPEALFPDGPDGREARSSEVDQILLSKIEWIKERLEGRWHPVTVYEELNLPIGRSSFYRFLHRHELYSINIKSRSRVIPEIVHQPGEALLLDWGKLRDVLDPETGKKRTLWAFAGILGYSRYLMVKLVWSNGTTETCLAIESMLKEIGGVPARVTSDNPKCFALEASVYEPLLNPVFERMGAHYGFRIECLPPGDPEKKGKIERPMPYIRRLYEAHGDGWFGIEESQGYLDKKLNIANERKHGTTRMQPIQQFLDIEVKKLKPLPPLSYTPEEISEGTVRRDGHVRFDSKYYSCDEKYIGQEVLLLASPSQVSIYSKGALIEIHERIPASNPLQSKSTKPHHLKPWEREMNDHSFYRKRAQALGAHVDEFVLRLIKQGNGFIDTRKIWGILSLDKTFPPTQINEACRQALEMDSLSYRMVKGLIKLLPRYSSPVQENEIKRTQRTTHKFVRPMSVYEEQLKLKLH